MVYMYIHKIEKAIFAFFIALMIVGLGGMVIWALAAILYMLFVSVLILSPPIAFGGTAATIILAIFIYRSM